MYFDEYIIYQSWLNKSRGCNTSMNPWISEICERISFFKNFLCVENWRNWNEQMNKRHKFRYHFSLVTRRRISFRQKKRMKRKSDWKISIWIKERFSFFIVYSWELLIKRTINHLSFQISSSDSPRTAKILLDKFRQNSVALWILSKDSGVERICTLGESMFSAIFNSAC